MSGLPSMDGRVVLRPTTDADLPFVLRAEGETDFVRHWPEEEHRRAMADPDAAHRVVEAHGRAAGYLILRGLRSPDRCLELKRIVIAERGKGLGREALRLVKELAFERLGAHRLWLDVMEHNHRARRLYLSEGFAPEGILREAVRVGDRFVSLVLMSILEGEYRA